MADKGAVVRSIVELLQAEHDEPEQITLPVVEKQGDETNMEWAARFGNEHYGSGEAWGVGVAEIEWEP